MRPCSHKGFSLVEIIVAAAIIAVVVTGVAGVMQAYIKMANVTAQNAQAALLTEETGEILRIWRDKGWTANIVPQSNGVAYHIEWTGTEYKATTTPMIIQNAFIRTFTLSEALRDANDSLSDTGNVDANTRKATITISPSGSGSPAIMTTDFLIHNVYKN